jgi:hypothetical protein
MNGIFNFFGVCFIRAHCIVDPFLRMDFKALFFFFRNATFGAVWATNYVFHDLFFLIISWSRDVNRQHCE